MTASATFASHEEYIAAALEELQPILRSIQDEVERAVPQATRCISYNLPAYRAGKVFFYFTAFKQHIGIYPPVRWDEALIKELAPFRNEKGNLRFPLSKPIPLELIGRIARTLAREIAGE